MAGQLLGEIAGVLILETRKATSNCGGSFFFGAALGFAPIGFDSLLREK